MVDAITDRMAKQFLGPDRTGTDVRKHIEATQEGHRRAVNVQAAHATFRELKEAWRDVDSPTNPVKELDGVRGSMVLEKRAIGVEKMGGDDEGTYLLSEEFQREVQSGLTPKE